MNLTEKIKETIYSVIPIMGIVLVLGVTITPLGNALLLQFLVGGALLILGLSLFLLGADLCIRPMGELIGTILTRKRNLKFLLALSFLTGVLVTVAEPDVIVLADQLVSFNKAVVKSALILAIAVGVGAFMVIGLLRTVLGKSYKALLFILYAGLLTLAFLTPADFLSVGFDAGGATTGPMTVPFIIAVGVGVASVRKGRENEDSFGLTGICSVGPVAAVLSYGLILTKKTGGAISAGETVAETIAASGGFSYLWGLVPEICREVAVALLPLTVLFVIFQLFLVKMPPVRLRRLIFGGIYAFLGLILFFTGVKGGFVPAGHRLGMLLGGLARENPMFAILIIALGAVLGAVVVAAEPAIWVLTDEVETVSGGAIKRKVLLITLSAGVAVAVALSMTRVLFGGDLLRGFLVPGYAVALTLTLFCPKLFVAVAFDSGGVATGPMTTTFILALTLGVSVAMGGNPVVDGFGIIALVALIPLIAIQVLGLLYRGKYREE
ncbi:MAG: DUF1538 domain-containing protein [Fusobacteriaceae bacterium]|jgi:hypothetical protein|nr:DUF1538 domain-containing protein [Fusobacteriaceae bacterium]